MIKFVQIIIFSILINSCINSADVKPVTKQKCIQWAYKSFKGLPKESNYFKKFCSDYNLEEIQKKCKEGLNKLILGKDSNFLIKNYGQDIMSCFTENDLSKFLIQKK